MWLSRVPASSIQPSHFCGFMTGLTQSSYFNLQKLSLSAFSSFVSKNWWATPRRVLNLHTCFISEMFVDCFVPWWIIFKVSGPKGRLVVATFSCSIQREWCPHAEAARTLMDGLAFCRFLVPDVRRCYENIEGSRADRPQRDGSLAYDGWPPAGHPP